MVEVEVGFWQRQGLHLSPIPMMNHSDQQEFINKIKENLYKVSIESPARLKGLIAPLRKV